MKTEKMQDSVTRFMAVVGKDPFRLFFPAGAVCAIAGVLPWLLLLAGIPDYPVDYHKSVMINGFMLSFVSGFLMTAIPRFTSTPFAKTHEIICVFCAIALTAIFGLSSHFSLSYLAASLALFALIIFGVRRFLTRKTNPPFTFVFVGLGLCLWLLSNGMMTLKYEGIAPLYSSSLVWSDLFSTGSIMSLVLGIGGRLIPGIFGWQDIVNHQRDRYEGTSDFRKAVPLSVWILVLVYLASFALSGLEARWIPLGLRAIVVCVFAFRYWMLQRFPKEKSYLTWGIWGSCWALVAGSIAVVLWRDYYAHALHIILISGFSLLTVLVGSRVTFAHSKKEKTSNPEKTSKSLLLIAAFLTIAGLVRSLALLWPSHYGNMLGYGAFVWLTGFLIWVWVVLPKIFKY